MRSKKCVWVDEGEYYKTSCGKAFCFNNTESPKDNNFKYCPYCGKKIGVKDEHK